MPLYHDRLVRKAHYYRNGRGGSSWAGAADRGNSFPALAAGGSDVLAGAPDRARSSEVALKDFCADANFCATPDESKAVAEAVAGVRQCMKELDVPSVPPNQIDQLPDSFIEAVIRTMRRIQSMPRAELEREIYGRPLDEATNEETKTA